jgi:hypothetical protein
LGTDCITTSHRLAKELLDRPDDFIFAMLDDEEYIVESIKTVKTFANRDDSVNHLALKLRRCENNNIKR